MLWLTVAGADWLTGKTTALPTVHGGHCIASLSVRVTPPGPATGASRSTPSRNHRLRRHMRHRRDVHARQHVHFALRLPVDEDGVVVAPIVCEVLGAQPVKPEVMNL